MKGDGFTKGFLWLKHYYLRCSTCGTVKEVIRFFYQGWTSPHEFRSFVCHKCELEDFAKRYPPGSKPPEGDFSSLGAELATYKDSNLWKELYSNKIGKEAMR